LAQEWKVAEEMRVGIIGSWKSGPGEWGIQGTREQFADACRTVGRELARRGLTIIVGGESPSTADVYVAEGALEIVRGTMPARPVIEVLGPQDDGTSYRAAAERNPGVFGFHTATQHRWSETHLLTVREADCVLAIAGMKGTYHAGLAAIVARKPLVPIASFGGAATRLLLDLKGVEAAEGIDSNYLLALNAPWSPATLAAALQRAGIGRRPKVMLIHGRSKDRFELQAWLSREPGLCEVLVMQEDFGDGESLPVKFERLARSTDGAIALATPDDLGGSTEAGSQRSRARQNVWLEVGWSTAPPVAWRSPIRAIDRTVAKRPRFC
jgi:hypothetical protein